MTDVTRLKAVADRLEDLASDLPKVIDQKDPCATEDEVAALLTAAERSAQHFSEAVKAWMTQQRAETIRVFVELGMDAENIAANGLFGPDFPVTQHFPSLNGGAAAFGEMLCVTAAEMLGETVALWHQHAEDGFLENLIGGGG